ncbi:MAG: RHS repeat-associated core domain-containing protein, partial [Gemmatimonadaceae bacterium]
SSWSVNWTGVDTMFTRIFPDSTKIRFNNLGRMRSVTDRFGNQTMFEYDGSARLLKVYDPFRLSGAGPGKAYIRLHYKSSGYGLDSIIGPGATGTETGGSVSRVTVGSDSLLTAFIDPDGDSTTFGYTGKRMTSVRDRRGSTTTYHLNALSSKVDSVSLPQVAIDAGNGSTTNQTIVLKYRAWQHAGVPTTSTYSALAAPISPDSMTGRLIDGGGDTTTFNPDRWGQPLWSRNALAQVTTIYRTQTSRPEPDSIKSHTGSVERFAYTGAFLTAYTNATGTVTNYRYGSYGQLDSTYGSSQPTTRYFRDNTKGGRVDSVRATTNATKKTRYYYNATYKDRPDSTKDPEGHRTTFRYDAIFGNLDSTLAPGGSYTKLIFDRFGRDSVVRSTSRVARGIAYDAVGRVRKRWLGTDTTSAVTYTYDQLFRTRVKDRKGQVYKFEFNALGWLTREYDSFDTTKSIQYRYNKDGLSTSRTTRRGHRVDQTFDQLHRIVSKRDTASLLDSLGYSTDGRKVASWNSVSRDSVFLAQSGWTDSVVTRIASKRFRVKYRPDALLRLDTMDVANDAGITFATRRYVYNSANAMLDRVKIGSDSVVFSYNADFLRTNTNYVPEHTNPVVYTSQHRYFTDTLKNSSGQQVFWRGVGYDTLGRVNQYLSDDATNTPHRRFAYDSLGQLSQDEKFTPNFPCPTDTIYGHKCTGTAVSTVNFRYDAAGNDTTTAFGATFSTSGNRMLTRGSVTYSYDADGHRTVVKKSSTDSTVYYWSPDGVLEKVVSAATTLEYSYNAAGELVRRKKNGSVDRIFLWANGHLLAELNGTATNRIAEYVYYPGMDAPLAVVSGPTTITGTRYFQQDALGNVTAVLGDLPKSGATAYQKLSYDAWGKVEQTTGGLFASDTNRLRWKGLVWEGDSTQLYYMRARWYDPTQRRFVSEDPIGLAGGINMYVFGGNEPLNSSDPLGLTGDVAGNCRDNCQVRNPQYASGGGFDDWCINTCVSGSPEADRNFESMRRLREAQTQDEADQQQGQPMLAQTGSSANPRYRGLMVNSQHPMYGPNSPPNSLVLNVSLDDKPGQTALLSLSFVRVEHANGLFYSQKMTYVGTLAFSAGVLRARAEIYVSKNGQTWWGVVTAMPQARQPVR